MAEFLNQANESKYILEDRKKNIKQGSKCFNGS